MLPLMQLSARRVKPFSVISSEQTVLLEERQQAAG